MPKETIKLAIKQKKSKSKKTKSPVMNLTKYKCDICDKTSSQKSHHQLHLKSNSHKKEEEILRLKLEKKTPKELAVNYQTTDIEYIINAKKNKKIFNDVETVNELIERPEPKKHKLQNKELWKKPKSEIQEDEKYLSCKNKLDNIIKRCHDTLYSNGSIVGDKARDDIMRLLTLKLLQSEFLKEDSDLWTKCNEVKAKLHMTDSKFTRLKSYCKDITLLYKNDKGSFKNQWKILVSQFLRHITDIYSTADELFNCDNNHGLEEITDIINELEVNQDFIDAYGTSCGDIHEIFATYGG